MDLVKGGGGVDGLVGAVNQQFVFIKNDSFQSAKATLHVEVYAKRSLVKDNVVVRGCIDLSRIEADPGVPHIIWLRLYNPSAFARVDACD